MNLKLRHAEDRSRYELLLDGEVVGRAEYHEADGAVVIPHTEVLTAHRGRGFGTVLVREVLDHVRARGQVVVPQCWFVREFLDAHPDYADVLAG